MASHVMTELADFKTEPLPIKLRPKTYERLHRDLVNREKDVFKARYARRLGKTCHLRKVLCSTSVLCSPNIPLNIADVGYIFEEVRQPDMTRLDGMSTVRLLTHLRTHKQIWRGRSALSKGFDKLQLTRWDVTKPAAFNNVICFTRAEADKHDKVLPGELEATYGKGFVDFVEERFEEERRIRKWR